MDKKKNRTTRNIKCLHSSFNTVLTWRMEVFHLSESTFCYWQLYIYSLITRLVGCYLVSKLVGKMLILSIESGSMCKHQGSSEQSGSYTTLSSCLRLNRTLCWINGSTPYLEKKKIIGERRRGFSMLLFPLPLARNKENWNIESRILIGCALCTMILVNTLAAARKRLL